MSLCNSYNGWDAITAVETMHSAFPSGVTPIPTWVWVRVWVPCLQPTPIPTVKTHRHPRGFSIPTLFPNFDGIHLDTVVGHKDTEVLDLGDFELAFLRLAEQVMLCQSFQDFAGNGAMCLKVVGEDQDVV